MTELDRLHEELDAERELARILREQVRLADERHRNDQVLLASERLLRRSKERPSQMRESLRDRVRRVAFEVLPELRNEVGSEAVNVLGELKSKIETLLSLSYRLQQTPRVVTVALLLPPDSWVEHVDESLPEAERKPVRHPIPLFQSWHARADLGPRVHNRREDGSVELQIPVKTYWKIPAGSWLVMHGARISRAYAGSFSLDRGPDGSFCRFERDVPPSEQLTVWAAID